MSNIKSDNFPENNNDSDDLLGLPSDSKYSGHQSVAKKSVSNNDDDEEIILPSDVQFKDDTSHKESVVSSKVQDQDQSSTISPGLQTLYEKSLKANESTQKQIQDQRHQESHQLARPNKSSITIAINRNNAIIDSIIGNSETLTEPEFIRLVKKFNIPYSIEPENGLGEIPSIYSQLSKYCLIKSDDNNENSEEETNEKSYDTEKLKTILKLAANGGKKSNLALRMKHKVSAALSNMPVATICHSSRHNNRSRASTTPKSQRTKQTKQNSSTSTPKASKCKMTIIFHSNINQNSNSDYDADEDVEDTPKKEEIETPKKATVSPRKLTPRGQKYLPGFYDNLDFYRSPK